MFGVTWDVHLSDVCFWKSLSNSIICLNFFINMDLLEEHLRPYSKTMYKLVTDNSKQKMLFSSYLIQTTL